MTYLELIKDPKRRVVLVVQGGGMRAVYTAAAMACLDHYRLQDHFTHAVGSSAGALNSAYFLAHQPGAVNVYIDLLSNKNFVDYRRKTIVDIDYLVDVALHRQFPIDIVKLREAKTNLHIVVTSAGSGRRFVIDDPLEFGDIYEEFRATTALPIFYDGKVKLKHKLFIDGGVSDLVPALYGASLNPTDIITILSQPLDAHADQRFSQKIILGLLRRIAFRQSDAIKKMLPTSTTNLRKNMKAINNGYIGDVKIHTVAPSQALTTGIATIDRQKLEASAEQGWADTENFLLREVAFS